MESSFGDVYHFMNRYFLHSPTEPSLHFDPSVHVAESSIVPAMVAPIRIA
jgi:hypothetical protein